MTNNLKVYSSYIDGLKFLIDYPEYINNLNKLNGLNMMDNIEDLKKLKEYFVDLQIAYYTITGISNLDFGIRDDRIFNDEINRIMKRIEVINLDKKFDIKFDPGDRVNGYSVSKYIGLDIKYLDFMEFKRIWQDNREMSYQEFSKIFNEIACAEWSKMDKYDEYYGGFWKYPEGSYEHEHAWHLCREDNCRALYELPYPKRFIIETIKIGCNNGLESVPFTNYLCEMMSRKLKILNEIKESY